MTALQIKMAVVALAVAALIGSGIWVRSVFAERDKFKAEAALQKASAEMYAQQFNSYIQLNREITDAIAKVKVQSNTYIDSVEASAPPVVADGDSFILIAPGVPKAVPSVSGYQNYSAGRAGPGAS